MKSSFISRPVIAAVLMGAVAFGCKPRQDEASLRSFQSLHKGGKTVLWYGAKDMIHICLLEAPVTNVKTIDSLEQYKELCGTGKNARMAKKEFAEMSANFLSNTTFKSLIRGQEILNSYTEFANRATREKDLVQQASGIALLMSQIEVLEYNLAKGTEELAEMDSFLAQASTGNTRPSDSEIKDIFGDAYARVKTTVEDLKKKQPTLQTNLEASAQTFSTAYESLLTLKGKFEGRIHTLIEEIFAKELKKASILQENSIDYAIFTNAAVQLGILDGGEVGVSQTSENSALARVACVTDSSATGAKYKMKMPTATSTMTLAEFNSMNNCEDMIAGYRVTGLVCSDVLNIVMIPKATPVLFGDAFPSFEECRLAVEASSKTQVCAPYQASFSSTPPGIYAWNRDKVTRADQFDNGPLGLKSCAEHVARQAQIDVVTSFFRSHVFSSVVKTPTISNPSTGNAGPSNPGGAQPTGNSGTNTNTNTNTPPASSPSIMTPVPEQLPANTDLLVDQVVAAMNAVKSKFSVDAQTRDACLQATQSATLSSWSDIMAHYYCQYPVYDNNGQASVRACFTGTLRGQGGYTKKDDYREAFDSCINRFEFDWIRTSNLVQFQYIMMSQRGLSGSSVRFSKASQRQALEKFYGSNIPVRRP